MAKRPIIGLALGGGGSKGLAHIGVIKVLEEQAIPIDLIAGSSIGALVGGFYAAKKSTNDLENIALQNNWRQVLPMFIDLSFTQGIIRGVKIQKFIKDYLGDRSFDNLEIPFTAVATDLETAEPVFLKSGDLASAIQASIAVPFLFRPVIRDDHMFADGGLSMQVPVEAVRQMGADIVIAVNLSEEYIGLKLTDKFGIDRITQKSISIMSRYLARHDIQAADIVLSPKVGHVGMFDKFFSEEGTKEVIYLGEEAMRSVLPALHLVIKNKTPKSSFTLIDMVRWTWSKIWH